MEKQRVMKFGDIGNSVYFRISCDCMSSKCDAHLELEMEAVGQLYLNITKKLMASAHWGYTDKWYYWDFLRVFINKIRMMCRILFFGYIEVNETLILGDWHHVDEFLTALEEGRRFLTELEREKPNEKNSDKDKP